MTQTFELPPFITDGNQEVARVVGRASKDSIEKDFPTAVQIRRDYIERNSKNPRREVKDAEIEDMRHSLAEHGQLQPIRVRPHPTKEDKYQIVMGERRWRASAPVTGWNGLEYLYCVVEDVDDATAFMQAFVENYDRKDLTVWEECEAIRQLQEVYAYSSKDIQRKLGKGRGWVENRIAAAKVGEDMSELLELPDVMSHVVEADKVKDPKGRQRLRALIRGGISFEALKSEVDILLNRPRTIIEAPPRPVASRQGTVPEMNYQPYSGGISTNRSTTIIERQFELIPGGQQEVLMTPEQFENRLDMEINYLNEAPQYVVDIADTYRVSEDARLRLRDKLQQIARLANAAAKKLGAME